MIRQIIFLMIFVTLISCNNGKEQKQKLIPNKKLSKILEDFVTENKCSTCNYEIYINKEYPHLSTIIIYMGDKSLTKDENEYGNQEIFNTIKTSSGVEFKIYSGIERYFKSEDGLTTQKKSIKFEREIKDSKRIVRKFWVVIDSFGVLKTTKRDFAYPFIPLPQFPAPKIKTR